MFTGRPTPYTERRTFYYWLFSRAARTYLPKPFAGSLIIFSSKGQAEWHIGYLEGPDREMAIHEIRAMYGKEEGA